MLTLVVAVVGARADAEIAPAVIGPVAVGMVDDHALRRLHDLAVHKDSPSLFGSGGVPLVVIPVPPAEPLVGGGVHVGVTTAAQSDHPDAFPLGRRGLGPVVAAGDARHIVQPAPPPRGGGALRPASF